MICFSFKLKFKVQEKFKTKYKVRNKLVLSISFLSEMTVSHMFYFYALYLNFYSLSLFYDITSKYDLIIDNTDYA